MLFPCSVPQQSTIWYNAAQVLHKAMWRQDLDKKLQKVTRGSDLKYLPPTEVNNLQLRELGCYADAILVRKEYLVTFKSLEDHRPNIGGVVVTGQPGIGTSFLQKDLGYFAHALITCRQINIFILFAPPAP
jgi:hypothetical protein